MPVGAYFGGAGNQVMANMTQEYGPKKGTSVFYATANKRGQKPGAAPAKKPGPFARLTPPGR